ncbi:MAG: hypothetical protein CVV47_05260 [Spirochaetae bacterium HGW-Spirochaetae-3]|jgi:hypothetical protein|nr:MAG: hypothetical protein CVV47_05260 [Spirochaetae bacterium HGW-Spirochaetae-3]
MDSETRHFARLFRVELDDLIEEMKLLVERMDKRYANGEITEYVHLENLALFKRELDAFVKFSVIVDGIDPSLYKCTTDIEADLLATSRDYVSRLEDPEAVYILLKRKIDKVGKFISSDDNAFTSQ